MQSPPPLRGRVRVGGAVLGMKLEADQLVGLRRAVDPPEPGAVRQPAERQQRAARRGDRRLGPCSGVEQEGAAARLAHLGDDNTAAIRYLRPFDGARGIVDQPGQRLIPRVVNAEALVRCRLGEDKGAPAVGEPAGARLHRGAEIEDLAIACALYIDEPDLRTGGIAGAARIEELPAFLFVQPPEVLPLRPPCYGAARAA